MTISSSNSTITVAGNGVQTVFQFSFIGGFTSNMVVLYNGPSNAIPVTLPNTAYTISLNNPAVGALWGVGGTVTYNPGGVPIPAGTSLTISRIVPLTQTTSVSNQGPYAPNVIESALDILEMQLQQVSNRTTQFRGTWTTGTAYNPGDIVQDGINGANTSNYYICSLANTSGVWATDLANGDWALSVQATVPVSNLTLTGAVTGTQSGSTVATTLSAGVVGTTNIAANAVTYAKMQTETANTVLGNPTGSTAVPSEIALTANQLLGRGSTGNVAPIALGTGLSMSGATLNATGGTGELILLGTATASSSASLNFTSLISSAYDYYFFILKDMLHASSSVLNMRWSTNNGSTYDSSVATAVNQLSLHAVAATTITVSTGGGSATSLGITATAGTSSYDGKINLLNPLSNATTPKLFWVTSDTGGNSLVEGYGGFSATNVNAVQFLASTGNITSGTIEMYGVKNT